MYLCVKDMLQNMDLQGLNGFEKKEKNYYWKR